MTNEQVQAQHTPGPWEVLAGTIVQEQNNGPTITSLKESLDDRHHDFFEIRANARLIAAAPELLEALKELAGVEFRHGSQAERNRQFAEAQAAARAAIAKAEGERGSEVHAQQTNPA